MSPSEVDLKVTRAKSTSDEVVGSATNTGTTALSPEGSEAFCFDSKGAMLGGSVDPIGSATTNAAGLPEITDITPGGVARIDIGLIEPPCPTFLVGAWGIIPS